MDGRISHGSAFLSSSSGQGKGFRQSNQARHEMKMDPL
jgi:hypothetical protein